MKNEKLALMINEFLDGELPKEKENYLFTSLGNDDRAREYFKKLNSIKLAVSETTEDFPAELEENILNRLKGEKNSTLISVWRKHRFSFLSAVVSVIILIAAFFFFNRINYQQKQLELAQKQMRQQKQLIELIMSSQLPPVTVKPDSQNEIVIQATL